MPSVAGWTLPATGTSQKSAPFSRARSAARRDAAGVTVEKSSQIFPEERPATRPSGPSATASSAAGSASIVQTTSAAAAASRGLVATVAPSSARGRSALRFQTVRGKPAWRIRRAMGVPIAPRPRKATRVMRAS